MCECVYIDAKYICDYIYKILLTGTITGFSLRLIASHLKILVIFLS